MQLDYYILDEYLQEWGRFVRLDRTTKQYTKPGWYDLVGGSSFQLDDPILDRTCRTMIFLRQSRPQVYNVLYQLYVERINIKYIGRKISLSRRRVAELKHDGFEFLAGVLFGSNLDPHTAGRILHWGEYPEGPIIKK